MSVGRHTSYNFIGSVVPVAVAVVTIPIYLKLVGPDRYGVLSIAWALLGYFGLFDLGLGQATAFRVASLRDAPAQARARTFWAALLLNACLGLAGALVLWAGARWFFGGVLKAPGSLRPEILRSLPLLAASVPVATISGVLTGALQGREKFLQTNMISMSSTALFQILPLTMAWVFGPDLTLLLAGALGARLLGLVALGYQCHLQLTRGHPVAAPRQEIATLLTYGRWVTVTAACGPLLVLTDRFLIGAMISATAVTIYMLPFQLTKQVAILPAALTNALFPKLAAASAAERRAMGEQATLVLASTMTLPVLGAIFLLEFIFHLWIGHHIGAQSAPIGRVLLIGFWANGLALVPYTLLRASDRPDLVTKTLLAEILPYFGALYVAMHYFGIIGAAWALAARFTADYLLLTFAAGRNYSTLPIVGADLGLLLAGSWCAGFWPITDWRWWLSAAVLGSVALALAWLSLPQAMRADAVRRVRGYLARTA